MMSEQEKPVAHVCQEQIDNDDYTFTHDVD